MPLLSFPAGNLTSQSGGGRSLWKAALLASDAFAKPHSPAELSRATQLEAREVQLGTRRQEAGL